MRSASAALPASAVLSTPAAPPFATIPGTALVVAVPAGWTASTDGLALNLTGGGAAIGVLSLAPRDGDDALSLREASARELADHLLGFSIVARDELAQGALVWQRLRYRFRIGQEQWEQQLHIARLDGRLCCVTLGAPAARIDAREPILRDLLASLGTSRAVIGK